MKNICIIKDIYIYVEHTHNEEHGHIYEECVNVAEYIHI